MVNSVQPSCILGFFEDSVSVADVHQAAAALRWSLIFAARRSPLLPACARGGGGAEGEGELNLKGKGRKREEKLSKEMREKKSKKEKQEMEINITFYILCPRN